MNIEKNQDFFGYVYDIFNEFAQKKPESVNLTFSRKNTYPSINRLPKISISIPLPKFKNGKFFFEGFVFENTYEQRCILWYLFLASIYHLAAHAAVSRYEIYQKWIRNKTNDICIRVIDFIEDVFVEKYISLIDPEIYRMVTDLDREFAKSENKVSKNAYPSNLLSYTFNVKENDVLVKAKTLLKQLENDDDYVTRILEIADFLYKNRQLLPKSVPYCEHIDSMSVPTYKKNIVGIEFGDRFKDIVYRLDELWSINEQTRARLLKQYEKHLQGLHFDSIVVPSENFCEFARIREQISPMLKRIRQQIRTIVNVTDDTKTDQIGYVDMQLAIQAIASEGRSIEFFERDEERRSDEAWIILIDKSASMNLRFEYVKEFAMCVAEAADELTGKSDAWAMYSFDNNFQILKDFKEKYGQQIQSRLGGLQNTGLSLLPDAIELSYKILAADSREKKFLFIITDGHPSGYDRISEQFSKITKKMEMSGIILIAIGVSKTTSKRFRNSARGNNLKQLVTKFIAAYRTVSSDM